MNYLYTITSIVTLLLTFILALYVYSEDRKNRLNISFSLLTISATLWILANFLTDISREESLVMIWSKLALVGPVLIAYFFYRFSVFFPKTKEVKIFYDRAILFVALIFILLSPTSLNISKVFIGARGVPEIVPGFLYIPFLIYFSIIFIFSSRYILKGYSAFTDTEKSQVRMVLSGISISAALGLLTNLILPLLGYSNFVNFGPYFILIFLALTAYTITRHHLFDIKVILAELFTFVVWVAVTTLAAMMDNLNGRILGGVVLVIVVIFGIFLIKYVKKVVALTEDLGISNEKLEASNRDLGISSKKLEISNENLEITNKKLEVSNRDLGIANEKLKGLDKLKSEFLSLASHQLRSPLTAIKGYISMLAEGSYGVLAEKQQEIVGNVLTSTQSMISMVEDFLNVSKIEQGGMQYAFAPTSLAKLVSDIFAEMKIVAKNAGLDFTLAMDPNDMYAIQADKGKLRQVFLNLIDNSIKYTPSGFVQITLARDANNKTITFLVKDSGAGISAEEKERLFEKFKRGNGSKLNTGGSGIGLYLAKEIVEAHHGRAWAESQGTGRGSTFFVELPAGENVLGNY